MQFQNSASCQEVCKSELIINYSAEGIVVTPDVPEGMKVFCHFVETKFQFQATSDVTAKNRTCFLNSVVINLTPSGHVDGEFCLTR